MVFVRPGHLEERATDSARSENARGQGLSQVTAQGVPDEPGAVTVLVRHTKRRYGEWQSLQLATSFGSPAIRTESGPVVRM